MSANITAASCLSRCSPIEKRTSAIRGGPGAARVEIPLMTRHSIAGVHWPGTGSVEHETQPVSVWTAQRKHCAQAVRLRRTTLYPLSYRRADRHDTCGVCV